MSAFAKLTVKNEWNYLTYYLGPLKLDEKRGGECDIRWPDGTVERLPFVSQGRHANVYDHGKRYDVTRRVLLVMVTMRGLQRLMPLEEFEINNVDQDGAQ